MKSSPWQIKVVLNSATDEEIFRDVEEKVDQGIPASIAIKIMLAERKVLQREVQTLRQALSLVDSSSGTFEGPLMDPSVPPPEPDRSESDSVGDGIYDLMEGYQVG